MYEESNKNSGEHLVILKKETPLTTDHSISTACLFCSSATKYRKESSAKIMASSKTLLLILIFAAVIQFESAFVGASPVFDNTLGKCGLLPVVYKLPAFLYSDVC